MKKEENAKRELKSIYFANYRETSFNDFNSISLLKLIIHKNSELSQEPFENGQIDESNVYNQVSLLAVNCMGKPIIRSLEQREKLYDIEGNVISDIRPEGARFED